MNLDALFNGMVRPLQPFVQTYRCYSIAMFQQTHVSDERVAEMENGGKILLPQSALDYLTRLHINYPMMFKLTNPDPQHQRVTHAGVMEFHQEEGKCYMPYWMMRNLLLSEDDHITVEYVSLPVGSYVKFQPQSADFLDISNPRAVLELRLRNFACLTNRDVIAIGYNNKVYEFLVEELQPANAVSIIECDMNVEFSKAVGYIEPEYKKQEDSETTPPVIAPSESLVQNKFVPFGGKGLRSDGKEKSNAPQTLDQVGATPKMSAAQSPNYVALPRGAPDYDYTPGTLRFMRTAPSKQKLGDQMKENEFKAFHGTGQSIKAKKT